MKAPASRASVAYAELEPETTSALEPIPGMNRFDTRRKKTREPNRKRPRRNPSGKEKKRAWFRPQYLLYTLTACALCIWLVYSQMSLTVVTREISEKESLLTELQSAHVALVTKRENIYNTDYIADYAQNRLGMVAGDAKQIEYVELSNDEKIEVSGTGASISSAIGILVRGFTAVLEYLR